MKTLIILSAFVLYAHVARGFPNEAKKSQADQADQAAPQNAPQNAPAADKPDVCTATVEGKQETLKPGDRYCLDEHTHRVCNWGGEFIDNPCPEGSKCLKSPNQFQVLCRIVNRNPPQNAPPQDSDVPPSPKSDSNPPPPPPPASAPAPAPAPASQQPQVDQAPPAQPPPPPPPAKEERREPHPTPAVDQPKPVDTATARPETCKATINGQDQTLQPGDRYCLDDNTNRVCNWGEFVDYPCPNGSKCLKSPDKWQVLCRIINKNPAQNAPGADGH